jgi:hypothetical protein
VELDAVDGDVVWGGGVWVQEAEEEKEEGGFALFDNLVLWFDRYFTILGACKCF